MSDLQTGQVGTFLKEKLSLIQPEQLSLLQAHMDVASSGIISVVRFANIIHPLLYYWNSFTA
jgi:hypothetical protein